MRCAVEIFMVLREFHVYISVFFGWVVGPFNIAVNGESEHNCGVPPQYPYTGYEPLLFFLYFSCVFSYNILIF